ncbi:flagellar biosynthetic protein FliQ [Thermincola ferriacetica]|uniref:Flagellar biosynthetic protein FliQ n=1 Tax=Thermincola ferriacetica TaxID=281456 RepID=A0A0L6W5W8_9FIRM|nr:flagellar biosynthesis protein FliQ [Thermincola ferriacetica]KNZ70871.1 flagellar biosynthetic protein FliQ [Thermincola ferriacetica]
MTPETIIGIGRDALITLLLISTPILATSLLIGVIISVFQAATHIQEQTLTFVPKILGILGAIVLFGSWMLDVLLSYTSNIFINLPSYIK